jgi:acylphosphatase
MAGTERVRKRVVYEGRVQGVGFRMTAVRLAEGHDVVGWVRNCADGTVELEAEGPAAAVDDFLVDVQAQFGENIADQRRTTLEVRGSEERFDVRY